MYANLPVLNTIRLAVEFRRIFSPPVLLFLTTDSTERNQNSNTFLKTIAFVTLEKNSGFTKKKIFSWILLLFSIVYTRRSVVGASPNKPQYNWIVLTAPSSGHYLHVYRNAQFFESI